MNTGYQCSDSNARRKKGGRLPRGLTAAVLMRCTGDCGRCLHFDPSYNQPTHWCSHCGRMTTWIVVGYTDGGRNRVHK